VLPAKHPFPPSPICLFSFYIKSEKIDGGGRSSKEKRGEKRGCVRLKKSKILY